MKTKVTIRDVAKAADMSIATVSGALNGVPGYAEKTVKHVWKIANELNYRPSSSARKLRKSQSDEIQEKTRIIMHIIHMNDVVPFHNQEIDQAAFRLAWDARKRNLFSIPYGYHQLEGFRCPPLLNGYVDGVLAGTPHLDVANAIIEKIPAVFMDVPFAPELKNIPVVNPDWEYGSTLLIKRLRELGHTNIVLIETTLTQNRICFSNGHLITDSFRNAAKKMNFSIDEDYSFRGDFSPENNLQLLQEYLPKLLKGIREGKVTALFAPGSSYLAILRDLLQKENISVPEDISLCCSLIDLDREKELSCIYMDRELIFQNALDQLEKLLNKEEISSLKIMVKPQLLENQTLGKSPKSNIKSQKGTKLCRIGKM